MESEVIEKREHEHNSEEPFRVLDEEQLPPVNEFKRFMRVFFRRKIVIFGFAMVVLILLMAAFADVIAPYGANEQDLYNTLSPPSRNHLLGTDALGRDLLSRIIYGTRISLLIGVATVIIAASIGVTIGLIAGFSEGPLGGLIMRATDALIAIPSIILMLLIAGALGFGLFGVIIAVGLTMFPGYIRMVYGQVLSVKQNDYVLASRAMGDKRWHIVVRHVLPNCLSPLIVMMTMMIGASIMAESGLSFLGLGITPPTPAWGSMCRDGYSVLSTRPLLSIAPGIAIVLLVFAFNMVGDGLRDALDPKLRGSLD